MKNKISQLVWFKRDLRVYDNRVLVEAAKQGPVLPLYVVEPELWRQPDMSARQWAFVREALQDLRLNLGHLGQPLIVRIGDICRILTDLHRSAGCSAIWSHEETGNQWTYERDKRVRSWCLEAGLPWYEMQQNGTQRRLSSRNGWAKTWDQTMAKPLTPPPVALQPLTKYIDPGNFPTANDLGLQEDSCPLRQTGRREHALERLSSFLYERGQSYQKDMSSPLQGANTCSRLSPYLAWGLISMREVAQKCIARSAEIKTLPKIEQGKWPGALKSFSGRLHWHCHFIQKLEDEPNLEFNNLHSAYNDLRPNADQSATTKMRLDAWTKGETGLPFVDACMRSLTATGWLNFRMRAMVMATASYQLWLDWRQPGEHLARQFTDYEAGIHWPQVQMQSGTTGINTIRIYNPVKQGYDQDPQGTFVRRWVPELRDIEDKFVQEPWKAENASAVLDKHYPLPIIDHLTAAKQARQKIWSVRGSQTFRDQATAIQKKHGSRKSGLPRRDRTVRRPQATDQLRLNLQEENGL